MASAGSLTADLRLESAAFIRDMGRAARAVETNTAQIRKSMRAVEAASRNVERQFGQLRNAAAALAGALAVHQFVKFTEAALATADSLAKQSRQIDLSAASFQRYRIEGQLAGVTTDKLESGVGAFVKRVGELRAGTGTLVTILDKSNKALKGQLLAAGSTEAALGIMLRTIRASGSAFEKQALSAAAFGRQAGQAMVLLADSAGTLSDEMVSLVSRSDSVLRAGEMLTDQITLLREAFSAGFDSAIIEGFVGAVDASVESMTAARTLGEQFGTAVGAAMRGVATAAQLVGDNLRLIAAGLAGIVVYKAATIFLGIASAVARYAAAVRTAAVATGALGAVLKVTPFGAIATAVGLIASAFVLLHTDTANAVESQVSYNDAITAANGVLQDSVTSARELAKQRAQEAIDTTTAALAVEKLTQAELARQAAAFQDIADAPTPRGAGQANITAAAAEEAARAATALAEADRRVAVLEGNLGKLQDRLKNGVAPAVQDNAAALDAAAKAARKAAETYDDALRALRREVGVLTLVAEGQDAQAASLKRLHEVQDIENRLVDAGIALTKEQREEIRRLVAERDRLKDAIDKQAEAEKKAQKAAEEAARAAKDAAEEQARVARQATDDVVRYAGDAFADLFSDTEFSWKSLWERMRQTAIQTLARIAAEALLRPIVTPIVGALFGGGGSAGGGTGLSAGGAAGGIGDLFGGNNPLSGLSTVFKLFNGPSVGTFFNTAGTVAGGGALIGSLGAKLLGGDPVVGGVSGALVGGLPGAVIGKLFGGLFGGGTSVGPNAATVIKQSGNKLFVAGSGADNGGDAAGTLAAARQAVDAVNRLVDVLGLTLDANVLGGDRLIRSGAGTSRGFTDAAGFVSALLARGGLTGASPEIDRVLRGSSADTLENNLTVLGAIPGLLRPATSAFDAAMQAVNDNFSEAEALARQFALDLDKVNAARAREIEAVRAQFRAPFLQAAGGIVDFLNAQSLASDSTLSPTRRLAEAQRQFGDLLQRVRGGDVAAGSALTQAAGNLLTIGRQNFASSLDFAGLERNVRSSLLGVADLVSSDAFFDAQMEATRQQTEVLSSDLGTVNDSVQQLRREVQLLRQALAA